MSGKSLFEYAVIRVVPCVEREEFVNVGVILYCQSHNFLDTLYLVNDKKINAIDAALDVEEVNERLLAFEKICKGKSEGGAIGQLSISSRFRWLTAARSTVIQTSPVHPGICDNPSDVLMRLYRQLVL